MHNQSPGGPVRFRSKNRERKSLRTVRSSQAAYLDWHHYGKCARVSNAFEQSLRLMSANACDNDKISIEDFFEKTPPGAERRVAAALNEYGKELWKLSTPEIRLHCASESCERETFHDCVGNASPNIYNSRVNDIFVTYQCRHCKTSLKTYGMRVIPRYPDVSARKFGEIPPFGPATPPALIRLLGDEREYFLKGRRAETQGMGVGAFAYYRRVVENRKNELIDQVVRVATHLGADQAVISQLEDAKAEISFAKSVDMIKLAIPSPLVLRGGHNSMMLLHSALSAGLHNDSDDACLALAQDIRSVLYDFVIRVESALRENAEFQQSVSRLMQRASGKSVEGEKTDKPRPGS